MRALEIRRKVTAEIFKESMIRKGKFGITYATNLTRRLSDFIDYVMVEAAAMKRLPDFSESTFNFRAKTVIDDSRVVPLIRSVLLNLVTVHCFLLCNVVYVLLFVVFWRKFCLIYQIW